MKFYGNHDIINKLKSKVEINGDCWIWNCTLSKGLPTIKFGIERYSARRLIFECCVGEVGDKEVHVICVCGNRQCINPEHLNLADRRENNQPNKFQTKLFCPAGHSYKLHGRMDTKGHQKCKLCHQIYKKKVLMKKKLMEISNDKI